MAERESTSDPRRASRVSVVARRQMYEDATVALQRSLATQLGILPSVSVLDLRVRARNRMWQLARRQRRRPGMANGAPEEGPLGASH